ncbi:phenylacetate--CoA ligase [Deltaproteobacteria bacterium OttesenSCG-928-M10]|nr:phenylacetate--CoA ligase [Deltaproteobacteria bacterium OttesenSCG-928-M10]
MIFDIEKETLPREELEGLQLRRLQDLCRRAYANVPFYKKKFDELGLKPDQIKTLKDMERLPFTEKQDLRDNYPYGFFAVPRDNVVRIHASSGTTGRVTVVGYTHRDVDNWADLMARSLAAAGAGRQDMVHVAYGYGLFTGGLGAHYGAERIGATVVPSSSGATRRQIQFMRDLGATVLCCTPSYALHLHEAAREEGLDFRDKSVMSLKIGVFGAEPWSEEMRQTIETAMGIDAMNIYGLSEVMGPGVSMECAEAKCGLHIFEDHFLPEIIDPVSGRVLPDGEEGELVLTTLTKEAVPLVRYRTRDITRLDPAPCRCGRTHRRMGRVMGRSDDMLIIRGVNVYPSQIEAVLVETEGLSPHYQIVLDRVDNLDVLEVQVELAEDFLIGGEVKRLQLMTRELTHRIKEFLGVTAQVRLVDPRSISRSEGKAQRVIDKRTAEKM